MSFELKLGFIKELAQGHRNALAARERLIKEPTSREPIEELHRFFHTIGPGAAGVGLPLLAALASTAECITKLALDRAGTVGPDTVFRVISEGINGVGAILDEHGVAEEAVFSRYPDPPTQPGWNETERVASKVLVIDDDPFSAGLVDSVLRAAGMQSSTCTDPEKALELVNTDPPDLIVLDVIMPKLDGFEVCRRLRALPAHQFTPVIFVTRKGDVDQRVRGLEVGANDYINKPFEPEELIARVRSHLTRLAVLREVAIRDGLTRCYNHKYFKTRLRQEIARSKRYKVPLTVAMIDIDHFKMVNDRYGHIAGDAVLVHLSGLIVASLRSTDVVARYGGEEFGLALVQSAAEESLIVTNRLRERIAGSRFVVQDAMSSRPQAEIPVTVSIGVAQLEKDDDMQSLLQRADAALYEAKNAGRNRVRVGKLA